MAQNALYPYPDPTLSMNGVEWMISSIKPLEVLISSSVKSEWYTSQDDDKDDMKQCHQALSTVKYGETSVIVFITSFHEVTSQ